MNLEPRKLSAIDGEYNQRVFEGKTAPIWDKAHAKGVKTLGSTPAFCDGAVVSMVSLAETIHAQESAYNDEGLLKSLWKTLTGQSRKERRTIIQNQRQLHRATQGVVIELARQQRIGAQALSRVSSNLVKTEKVLRDAARIRRDMAGILAAVHQDLGHLRAQVEVLANEGGALRSRVELLEWRQRVGDGRFYDGTTGYSALLVSSYDLQQMFQDRMDTLEHAHWEDYLSTCTRHLGLRPGKALCGFQKL